MTGDTEEARFVAAHTRLLPCPHVPEILLHQADEANTLWAMTEERLGAAGLAPPFWAFPWPGGQALARHLLDHPAIVAGRSVLDLASGSGLVALAALRAGARSAVALDVDPLAAAAATLNAAANGLEGLVTVTVAASAWPHGAEVVTAADVFYERAMAESILARLQRAAAEGATVLVGDPARTYLPRGVLRELDVQIIPVRSELEDGNSVLAAVYALAGWRS